MDERIRREMVIRGVLWGSRLSGVGDEYDACGGLRVLR